MLRGVCRARNSTPVHAPPTPSHAHQRPTRPPAMECHRFECAAAHDENTNATCHSPNVQRKSTSFGIGRPWQFSPGTAGRRAGGDHAPCPTAHPSRRSVAPTAARSLRRLHLEQEAERGSRSEAVRTGATPVLPPVRERKEKRDNSRAEQSMPGSDRNACSREMASMIFFRSQLMQADRMAWSCMHRMDIAMLLRVLGTEQAAHARS